MSFRLASRSLQVAKAVSPRVLAPSAAKFSTSQRASTDVVAQKKANALIDALPGTTLLSKTGIITFTTAVSAAAISTELFVLNEEVVILGSFVIFLGYVASAVGPSYTSWADGQIQKVKDILNTSRTAHVEAVQSRITSVGELKDVEALTTQLFELSKQTAQFEHETFALRQQAALTAEVKSVLDAWVRHEAQVREAEQRDLVQTVLANVQKALADKKIQRDILLASVAEVEALVKAKAI